MEFIDCLKSVSIILLETCIHEVSGHTHRDFYPIEYVTLANFILNRDMNITQYNIHIDNAKACYNHLVNEIQW